MCSSYVMFVHRYVRMVIFYGLFPEAFFHSRVNGARPVTTDYVYGDELMREQQQHACQCRHLGVHNALIEKQAWLPLRYGFDCGDTPETP